MLISESTPSLAAVSLRSAVEPIVEALENRQLMSSSYLIAGTTRDGGIFDATHNQIDVPTTSGTVLRFDLNSKTMLSSWTGIGGSLGGGDITPDGKSLYVADTTTSSGQGLVHVIDVATGKTKNLPYTMSYDDAPKNVVITSDGKAWVMHTGQWGNIRAISTSTQAYVTPTGPLVYGGTLVRGADRSLAYNTDLGVSPPSASEYDALSHTWTGPVWNSGGSIAVAVSPTGSEIATGTGFVNRTGGLIRTEPAAVTPLGYDPTGTILYTLGNGQINAISPTTFATKFTIPLPSDVTAATAAYNPLGIATSDGRWLMVTGAAGVHVFDLSAYNPALGGGTISGSVKNSSGTALSGVSLYLDTNNNSKLDSGELTTKTSATGTYSFSKVPTGATVIRQVLPTGDTQVTPSGGLGIHVTVTNGGVFSNENFVDKPTVVSTFSIAGEVFNDANGNGKLDSAELGLGLWQVYIDANKDSKYDAGDTLATTDINGSWSFTGLAAGTYVIRVVQVSGTKTTTAGNGVETVVLAAAQKVTSQLFGEERIA